MSQTFQTCSDEVACAVHSARVRTPALACSACSAAGLRSDPPHRVRGPQCPRRGDGSPLTPGSAVGMREPGRALPSPVCVGSVCCHNGTHSKKPVTRQGQAIGSRAETGQNRGWGAPQRLRGPGSGTCASLVPREAPTLPDTPFGPRSPPSLPSPASRPEPATWLPESSASPGVLPVARAVGGQASGLARVRALAPQSGGHAVSRNVRGPCRRRGCSGLPRAHARLAGTRPRRPHPRPACASGTRAEPELRGSVTAAGADGP